MTGVRLVIAIACALNGSALWGVLADRHAELPYAALAPGICLIVLCYVAALALVAGLERDP